MNRPLQGGVLVGFGPFCWYVVGISGTFRALPPHDASIILLIDECTPYTRWIISMYSIKLASYRWNPGFNFTDSATSKFPPSLIRNTGVICRLLLTAVESKWYLINPNALALLLSFLWAEPWEPSSVYSSQLPRHSLLWWTALPYNRLIPFFASMKEGDTVEIAEHGPFTFFAACDSSAVSMRLLSSIELHYSSIKGTACFS